MLQIKSLKSAYIIPAIIVAISIILVILFPNKPPKIVDTSFFQSPINPKISVSFSEPMDKLSLIEGGFITTPRLDGDFSWSGNTLFFTPQENLEFNSIYKLQINSTVKSAEGEHLDETFNYEIKTDSRSFFYLNAAGEILSHELSAANSNSITNQNISVLDFDYDPISRQIVALAIDKDEKTPEVFLIDIENETQNKLKKVSSPEHKIHFVKWLPFENALLISRNKIQHPEDTELIRYDLENKETKLLTTGNSLIYEFYPSPDGFKVAYINDQGTFILRDINSGKETAITSQFFDYYGFSDFGNYAIYLFEDNIVLQDTTGEKTTIPIDEINAQVIDPSISPDEETIVFVTVNEFGDYKLQSTNIQQPAKSLIADGLNKISSPIFSPDGKYLLFIGEDFSGTSSAFLYEFSSGALEKLDPETGKAEWQN